MNPSHFSSCFPTLKREREGIKSVDFSGHLTLLRDRISVNVLTDRKHSPSLLCRGALEERESSVDIYWIFCEANKN